MYSPLLKHTLSTEWTQSWMSVTLSESLNHLRLKNTADSWAETVYLRTSLVYLRGWGQETCTGSLRRTHLCQKSTNAVWPSGWRLERRDGGRNFSFLFFVVWHWAALNGFICPWVETFFAADKVPMTHSRKRPQPVCCRLWRSSLSAWTDRCWRELPSCHTDLPAEKICSWWKGQFIFQKPVASIVVQTRGSSCCATMHHAREIPLQIFVLPIHKHGKSIVNNHPVSRCWVVRHFGTNPPTFYELKTRNRSGPAVYSPDWCRKCKQLFRSLCVLQLHFSRRKGLWCVVCTQNLQRKLNVLEQMNCSRKDFAQTVYN